MTDHRNDHDDSAPLTSHGEQLGRQATAMRAMTPQEMADRERQSRHEAEARLRAYLDLPCEGNFEGLVEVMRRHQYNWMNGRKRVVTVD